VQQRTGAIGNRRESVKKKNIDKLKNYRLLCNGLARRWSRLNVLNVRRGGVGEAVNPYGVNYPISTYTGRRLCRHDDAVFMFYMLRNTNLNRHSYQLSVKLVLETFAGGYNLSASKYRLFFTFFRKVFVTSSNPDQHIRERVLTHYLNNTITQ
jgi:hypothetical protein